MIHGSSRRLLQSIAASFGVWGYRNRFLRSITNVSTQVKKKIETSEILFERHPFDTDTLQCTGTCSTTVPGRAVDVHVPPLN
jgi:hypothetical protein